MPGSVWQDTAAIVEQLNTIIELLQTISGQLSDLQGVSPPGGTD